MNKFMAFLPVILLVSTQLVAEPPFNPPPIEVDSFIVNGEANPVPVVVQPGGITRSPINLHASGIIETGDLSSGFIDILTVPDNQFLVIEYVSIRAVGGLNLASDIRVFLRLITTAGGNQAAHRINSAPLVSSDIPEQAGGSLVKVYADPESIVKVIADRGCCGSTGVAVEMSFSGYLTNQP